MASPLMPIEKTDAPAGRAIDLDAATLAELNAAFEAGTLSSETLLQSSMARIQAYDRQGPKLNAVITLNPAALETARALDAERRATGPRSPLHGIPFVLKDNFDTFDMPTTGGSVLLEGSVPPDDAFVVKKLRAAGAVVLAKVNMSEFASAGTFSSILGYSRNPHDLMRSTSGSSGGTGVAIAAGYAPLGLGTDTGGSIRGPAAANGIAALKPTHGLLSRDGIIPLALSLDTAGPMARNVHDIALALGLMTGVDLADGATQQSEGRFLDDYTKDLDPAALDGARIGVARDFMGADADVDWVVKSGLDTMRRAGSTLIEVRYPKWLLDAKDDFFDAIRMAEFGPQIAAYLATTGRDYPKSLAQLIERSLRLPSKRPNGTGPNPGRWAQFEREAASGTLQDYRYTSVRDHAMPLVRAAIDGILASANLDAIVYPTALRRAALVAGPTADPTGPAPGSATNVANLAGLPDLVVPAGFTGDGLPVGISFLGAAFSEQKLLSLGYSFEQSSRARRRPIHTPALEGDWISLP
jgi:amidase